MSADAPVVEPVAPAAAAVVPAVVTTAEPEKKLENIVADAAPEKQEEAKTPEQIKAAADTALKATLDSYADVKLPEGASADDKLYSGFKESAAKAGLTKDQVQALVGEFGGKIVTADQIKELSESPYKLWEKTQVEWQDAVRADKEIGGANFEPMKASIAKAITEIGGADAAKIREAFNFTGAGNNPEIIRFLFRVSKAVNEGGHISGKPAGGSASAADKLYPSQKGLANSGL